MEDQVTAGSRYADLESHRIPYLLRARECSLLTIPSLVPPQNFTPTSDLYTPYQSLGARGVNNLASKLLLSLLPPNTPFFRLTMSDKVLEQLQGQDRTPFDQALSKIEQTTIREIETRQIRVYAFEALKHLIVAGNVLFHFPRTGSPKTFPLSQYVVKRDNAGNVMEIVVEERVSLDELPEEVRLQVEDDEVEGPEEAGDECEEVKLYTWIRRGDPDQNESPKRFYIHQEVEGHILPGSKGEYPEDKLPWLPLRWIRISGEDYGRGYCEEYIGDLKSMEGLEASIVEGAAASSRVLILVNPTSGLTKVEDVAEAPNGACVPGKEDDVTALTVNKGDDFKTAATEIDRIERRLSYAFLLNSAIQRNGERVTAQEIQYMAGELENALGGVYSVLSIEFQLPLVQIMLAQLNREGKLPALPKNTVQPTIITGVDALGRNAETQKLQDLLGQSVQLFGPEVTAQWFNPGEVLNRMAAARGIDTTNLIRSEQEIQAQQQQQQQQAMMQKLGPAGIKAVSDNAMQMRDQQNQPQQQATE
jgi:hypothetical protein